MAKAIWLLALGGIHDGSCIWGAEARLWRRGHRPDSLDVTTWIPVINDFPAVSISQQKDQLSVSISHQAPLESSKFGWLIRSSVDVVLPMATVLNAQFGSSVFKLDRFACEMEPSKLLPQCLYIAAWNIH